MSCRTRKDLDVRGWQTGCRLTQPLLSCVTWGTFLPLNTKGGWAHPLCGVVEGSEQTHKVSSADIKVWDKKTRDPAQRASGESRWAVARAALLWSQLTLFQRPLPSEPNSASGSHSGCTESGYAPESVLLCHLHALTQSHFGSFECSVCCVWSSILKKI